MFSGKTPMRALLFGAAALMMASFAMPNSDVAFAASEVKVLVNNQVITSGDVAKRVNFLKLQHQKGDLNKLAQQQLVDETLPLVALPPATRCHNSSSVRFSTRWA